MIHWFSNHHLAEAAAFHKRLPMILGPEDVVILKSSLSRFHHGVLKHNQRAFVDAAFM